MNCKYFFIIFIFLYSCATSDFNNTKKAEIIPSEVYSNKGFTLLFSEDLKKKKIN